MATQAIPQPGGFLNESYASSAAGGPVAGNDEDQRPLDKRVKWSNAAASALKTHRSSVTAEIKRNTDLFNDKQWETFSSGSRAKWKLSAVLNYCAWIVRRKAALLADNKPKVTFVTVKREDDWQARILTSAWNDFYDDDHLQQKIEDVAKLAEIQKTSFFYPTFDPFNGVHGAITVRVVPGISVYFNDGAKNVYDATEILYEYTMPIGEVYSRWKHLIGKRVLMSTGARDDDADTSRGGGQKIQPSQSYPNKDGSTSHYAPYLAPQGGEEPYNSGRSLVREWWTRPRGPSAHTKVKGLVFNVLGEVATRPKMLEYEDGSSEPMQTVVMAGNVVYELPRSTVERLRFAADMLGGVAVLSVEDALEVQTENREVPLYPFGRRMIIVGSEVADDGANPFAHGRIPLIKHDSERDPTQPFGRCIIDRIASLQDAANRIVSLVFDAAHLTANPIWRMPLNSDIADEEITNAPGAIQREDMNSLRLGKREAGPELPSYVMQYVMFIISQMKELADQSEAATGGKFKGQQAAETVSMYQEAANLPNRQSIRNMEQAIIELGDQFKGLVTQFYDDTRFVKIKNDNGIEQHIPYIGTKLNSPMKMHAKGGSNLPTSPSARLNYVLQLMNTPAMDLPELWRNLEDLGIIDSASTIEKRIMREMADPRMKWLVPALNAPPKQGRGNKKNAGRSARNRTPSQGAGA